VIVLYPNEQILFQKEAKITIRVKLGKGKIEGKGILYITNMRIVFEDNRMGILTQFALNEMHGYRKIKGFFSEKLSIDYQRSHSKDVLVAELEMKDVNTAHSLLDALSGNAVVIGNNNYNMMINSNNNAYIDDTPEWIKPWVKDIKFTWNPRARAKELGFIDADDDRDWKYFEHYVFVINNDFELYVGRIDTSKFADDFKYKVAKEAYRMRANFPIERYFTYDSNKYWVGIIPNAYKDGKDELVGININAYHGSGYFIYSPESWFSDLHSVVGRHYDYKKDKPYTFINEELQRLEGTKYELLGTSAKKFYFAIFNKDFKTAEIALKEINETYKKYNVYNKREMDYEWLNVTAMYGLLLRYAVEMDKRNIPFPTPSNIKRSPI